MIFCQTRKTAGWLADELKKDGHAVALLSGDLGPDERILVNIKIHPTQGWSFQRIE